MRILYNVYANADIMNKGFDCLFKTLGSVDAERFIAALKKDHFDYTKWQREFFDNRDADELAETALRYDDENPII